MESKNGILYFVATPIGNLEDITLRAVRILKEVDIIAAEDTRHTSKLLNHLGIKKPIVSYHEHNKRKREKKLIDILLQGKTVALVSDAGTPGISDPGSDILKEAIQNNITVTMLPGCCAIIPALVLSGLSTRRFIFEGFLPNTKGERRKRLNSLKEEHRTIILYESPHRLLDTLKDIFAVIGDRNCSISRELTKKHEQILRGSINEIIEYFQKIPPRGEFVIALEGISKEKLNEEEKKKWNEMTIKQHMNIYLKQGFTEKEAMKKVAKDRKLSKSKIYKQWLESK